MPVLRRVLPLLVAAACLVAEGCADDGPPGAVPDTPPSGAAPPTSEPGPGGTGTTPSTGTAEPTASAAPAPSASAGPTDRSTGEPPSTPATTAAPATTAPPPPVPQGDPSAPRPPLTNAGGESEAFSGVGRIEGLGPPCTAFLLAVGEPSGPAYAMTTGRCAGASDEATVVRDRPVDGAVVRFGRFVDTPGELAEVPITAVRYATVRGADVAVLELGVPRAGVIGLASYGVAAPPSEGDGIRVVGVPVEGLDVADWVLRGGTCTAGPAVRLVEGRSLWPDVVSSDCGGVLDGSAGSPVFATGSAARVRAMVATSSLGVAPGGTCGHGRPCEVGPDGAGSVPDRTYAVDVQAWADCFTPAWDPAAAGCPVEAAPTTVDVPARAARPGATWGATVGGGAGGPYVVKAGPVAATDCRDAAGYAPLGPAPTLDAVVADAEGVFVVCAASLDADGGPDTAAAGSAVMVLDATPPDAPVELATSRSEGALRIAPVPSPPEHASFLVKLGPAGATDCADEQGYADHAGEPIPVPAADLPVTVCVIGVDDAGNRGAPQMSEVS